VAQDTPPPSADVPPRRPKGPGDYRPDLRPMLILVALLAAVIVAWVLLSPLILPAR